MSKMTAATVKDLHAARKRMAVLANMLDAQAVAVARRHTAGNFAKFQELRKLHATWCDIERTIRAQLAAQAQGEQNAAMERERAEMLAKGIAPQGGM